MATGVRTVGKDCLCSRSTKVLVRAEQQAGPWFTGVRHSQPFSPQPAPGFPMKSSSHTRCSCAILGSHMIEEQSSGAGSCTPRQVESAQGCRRRRRGSLRQISLQSYRREQKRTALSDSSKATYRGPLDKRTPSVLLYLPTRVSGWTLSRRCQP